MNSYKIATELSIELAEKELSNNMKFCMIEDSDLKAKKIRELSESNLDQSNSLVQDFRAKQNNIYGAIYHLLEGFNGYRIVKERQ